MTDPLSPDGPRRLLSELCRLAAERESVEEEADAGFSARNEAAEREFQGSERATAERYRARKAAAEAEYASARREVETKFRTQYDALQQEYESVRAEVLARAESDAQAAEQALQDSHWEALEAADAARGGLNLPLKDLLAGLDDRWRQLQEILQQAVALMQHRGHWDGLPPPAPTDVILDRHPGRRFYHALEQAQAQWRKLAKQRLPRPLSRAAPFWIFFLLWIVAAAPWFAALRLDDPLLSVVGSFGCAALVEVVAGIWTYRVAKRRSVAAYLALRQTLLEAGLGSATTLETAKSDCRRLDAAIIARHKAQTQKADEEHAAVTARIERRRAHDLQQADGQLSAAAGRLGGLAGRDARGDRGKVPSLAPATGRAFRRGIRRGSRPPPARPGREPAATSSRSGGTWPSAGDPASSSSAVGPTRRTRRAGRRFPTGTAPSGTAGRRRRPSPPLSPWATGR